MKSSKAIYFKIKGAMIITILNSFGEYSPSSQIDLFPSKIKLNIVYVVFEQTEEKTRIPLAISQCLVSDWKQPTAFIDARSAKGKRMYLDYEEIKSKVGLNIIVLCWIGDTHFLRKQLRVAEQIFVEMEEGYRQQIDSFFLDFLPWKGRLILVLKNRWNDQQIMKRRIHLRYRIAEDYVWVLRNVNEEFHMIKENLELLSDVSQEGRSYERSI